MLSNYKKSVHTSQLYVNHPSYVNPFRTYVLHLYPLKTPGKRRFSHVFKGCRKERLVWNGSSELSPLIFLFKFNLCHYKIYQPTKCFAVIYIKADHVDNALITLIEILNDLHLLLAFAKFKLSNLFGMAKFI